MRVIKHIVLHCTATQPNATVDSIKNYWKNNLGWKNPGYHYIIDEKGKVTKLQPIEKLSNGVRGYNANSIHISYIGGVDKNGKPKDTRTEDQLFAMTDLLMYLKSKFPNAQILGHRDFPNVKKACPSFEVEDYLIEIGLYDS